ncbi:MAG: hypothetical protein PHX79_03275 [Sphaerochaetaceae bacterium]|nr:hypothetical protein [Sphaerochaetaceae bacterium]
MKKMNFDEFQNRISEVNKAYRIFKPLTNNMTEAFRLYQEVLAEEKMEIFVSTAVFGNRSMTPMDDYERPLCPDCNSPMRFRMIPPNDEGVNTQLVCENCDLVLDSEKTMQEWFNLLEKKSDNGLLEDTKKTE